MKIFLPNDSQQGIGGGWTFRRNFEKGMQSIGHEIVADITQADIALVVGVTMVTWATMEAIKQTKAKIIVRLDNVPRNSRNRNTGTSRLQGFCKMADDVIWQCQWAKDYLIDFIGKEGHIVFNGVDTNIFKTEGVKVDFGNREHIYLYSRFNRDETKNWEVAWYEYQLIQRADKDAKLIIVGKFSPETTQYNFDFFRGERVEFQSVIDNAETMARIMRGCKYLFATYYNDCYSNTYQEALACGMELYKPNMSGGTPELIKNGVISLEQMARAYEKVFMEVLSK